MQSRTLRAVQSFDLFSTRTLLKYFHSLHSISVSWAGVVRGFLPNNKVPVRGGFLRWRPSINTSSINTSQPGTAASFHAWHGEWWHETWMKEMGRERDVNYSTNGNSSVSHKEGSALGIDRAFWCASRSSLLFCTAFKKRIHIGVTKSVRSAVHLCLSLSAWCSRSVPCTKMQFLCTLCHHYFAVPSVFCSPGGTELLCPPFLARDLIS